MYIWQTAKWPAFTWDERKLSTLLAHVSREQGRLLGNMETLGLNLREEANLRTLTEDVVQSSEIEGETLDRAQVRSSIARHLGMHIGGLVPVDRDVEGVVEMMLDATGNRSALLTAKRLFAWHAALFPTGRSGMRKIRVGAWRDDRDGPMEVISGPLGRERVHFRAPPAARVPGEIGKFVRWFEDPPALDPLLLASIAHLWFITIHPFDDGNGRIARAIADMALARAENTGQRFYSVSAQLRRERNDYYTALESTQKGGLDISRWHDWFLGCLGRAIDGAHEMLGVVLDKARFWERFAAAPLNARQIKVLNKLLDGFDGKLTTSKWAKLAKCSQDTAHRDIIDLVARGALRKEAAGGRSTSYALVRVKP